jgi:hypothetical protein
LEGDDVGVDVGVVSGEVDGIGEEDESGPLVGTGALPGVFVETGVCDGGGVGASVGIGVGDG